MSKRKRIEKLAVFIGLRSAHEIMMEFTNKPDAISHLGKEVDTYNDLIFGLAEGNWNKEDVKRIEKLAEKRCRKKLAKYEDVGNKKYKKIKNTVENIITELELV